MANDQIPLINGVRHSWASISMNFYGRTVTGFTALNYEETRKKENHYGAGSNPVHRGYGNKEVKVSITLYKYEVEALQKIAPNGDITKLPPTDIPACFLPEGSDGLSTDVVRNVEITNNKRDIKQGDLVIAVTLECIASHIDWHK